MASILAMLIVGYQFISTSPAPPRELAYRALPSQMGSGKVARGWFVGSRHGTTVGTELRQPADRFSTVVSADQIATVDRASRGPERIDRHGWGGFTRFAAYWQLWIFVALFFVAFFWIGHFLIERLKRKSLRT
jgi:hypothetical protein